LQDPLSTTCLLEWLSQISYADMYAVTLTMKQNNNGVTLDTVTASQNLRHFLNVLNQTVFGNAYRRYGKKLKVIPVIEMSAWDRLHYHLSLEKPDFISEERFNQLITSSWMKTDFARREIDVQKIYSSGWTSYCLKGRDPLQAIDFENLNFD
jgi:hypothetical protein